MNLLCSLEDTDAAALEDDPIEAVGAEDLHRRPDRNDRPDDNHIVSGGARVHHTIPLPIFVRNVEADADRLR